MSWFYSHEAAVVSKILGTSLVAMGSILLAFRVKSLVDIIIDALYMHDFGITKIIEAINNKGITTVVPTGFVQQVARIKKAHTITLVLGFGCIAVGSALSGYSAWLGYCLTPPNP